MSRKRNQLTVSYQGWEVVQATIIGYQLIIGLFLLSYCAIWVDYPCREYVVSILMLILFLLGNLAVFGFATLMNYLDGQAYYYSGKVMHLDHAGIHIIQPEKRFIPYDEIIQVKYAHQDLDWDREDRMDLQCNTDRVEIHYRSSKGTAEILTFHCWITNVHWRFFQSILADYGIDLLT